MKTGTEKSPSTGGSGPTTVQAFWKAKLRCPGFLSLLLAVATLAVFLPAVRHDFVNYDDGDYVTANAHVQSGLKWENVVWAFTTSHVYNIKGVLKSMTYPSGRVVNLNYATGGGCCNSRLASVVDQTTSTTVYGGLSYNAAGELPRR